MAPAQLEDTAWMCWCCSTRATLGPIVWAISCGGLSRNWNMQAFGVPPLELNSAGRCPSADPGWPHKSGSHISVCASEIWYTQMTSTKSLLFWNYTEQSYNITWKCKMHACNWMHNTFCQISFTCHYIKNNWWGQEQQQQQKPPLYFWIPLTTSTSI